MRALLIGAAALMYLIFCLTPPDVAATRWEVYMLPLAVVTVTFAAWRAHLL